MAHMVHMQGDECLLKPRSNLMVWIVNILISVMTISGLYCIGLVVGRTTVGDNLLTSLLSISGAALGVATILALKPYFFVDNGVANSFLTKDRLRSLMGEEDIFVLYGPGLHPSYLWEGREEGNNILAQEISQEIEFSVQCKDGVLKGKGSFRLRPDAGNPIAFLTSVAAVSEDLTDIITVEAVKELANSKVEKATRMLTPLNEKLKELFRDGNTEFERRFSVRVGDVTVASLLPNEEVQKTLSALAEANAIKIGTAMILGLSQRAVAKGLLDGTLSKEVYEKARRDFLAVSGNLEGMNIERKEWSIEGLEGLRNLTPETAKAIVAMVSQLTGRTTAGPKPKGGTK